MKYFNAKNAMIAEKYCYNLRPIAENLRGLKRPGRFSIDEIIKTSQV